jgi:hypothetical protein
VALVGAVLGHTQSVSDLYRSARAAISRPLSALSAETSYLCDTLFIPSPQ